MGKIKTLKNWDFFAALSNRRLSVQTLVQNYKLDWHIDRITIVGELAYDLEELGNVLVQHGFAKESYNGFNLIDEYRRYERENIKLKNENKTLKEKLNRYWEVINRLSINIYEKYEGISNAAKEKIDDFLDRSIDYVDEVDQESDWIYQEDELDL